MKIVATAPVPPVARELFADLGEIEVRTPNDVGDADVVLLRGTPFDSAAMLASPRLKVIARTGAGFDNIDLATATSRGIAVLYAPGEGRRAIAEGTLALILAATKRLGELSNVVRSGAWERRYEYAGRDVDGLLLGVVGLGKIGAEVVRLASAIGMQVIAHDPWTKRSQSIESVTLEELFERADVISLHCALTDETRGLVDAALLARAKAGAVLVNAARGKIVESEEVLLTALHSGQLSAVALDVYPSEPPDHTHPLYADPRVICTPHAIGLTDGWNRAVFHKLAHSLAELIAGRAPRNLLNPEVLSELGELGLAADATLGRAGTTQPA